MTTNSAYLLLSLQRALLGTITPNLRAVTVDFVEINSYLNICFFYHGEVSEEVAEDINCALTEIDLDPPIIFNRNEDFIIRLDYPQKIPVQGRIVYLRNEYPPLLFKQKKSIEMANQSLPPMAKFLLETQDALLGKVTPELRKLSIIVDENSKTSELFFYYDGTISEKIYLLAQDTIKDISSAFSDYRVNQHIQQIDFPTKIETTNARTAYLRKEPLL
jgi:hypothetical protein